MKNELVKLHIYSPIEIVFLVFKYLQLTVIYLSSGHLALISQFVGYMLSKGEVCFKLAVTIWIVYLGVYVSSQICPSYFEINNSDNDIQRQS